jgi:hypothetical protein
VCLYTVRPEAMNKHRCTRDCFVLAEVTAAAIRSEMQREDWLESTILRQDCSCVRHKSFTPGNMNIP